ncbi:MAG: hypothetical protein WCF83_08765, partial [Pseudolabrys sp.]
SWATTRRRQLGRKAALFLASWVIMMVAMMFPTAAPMILHFQHFVWACSTDFIVWAAAGFCSSFSSRSA